MKRCRLLLLVCTLLTACDAHPVPSAPPPGPVSPAVPAATVEATIAGLAATSDSLEGVPFRDVVHGSTGHAVLQVSPDAADQALTDHIAGAARAVITWLNAEDSPVRGLRRINEASRPVEDKLRELLNAGDFTCEVPHTADGNAQRSGYPDLRLVHTPSGRVSYLDPKLFEATSRRSSLRTFYYEPRTLTGKIAEDARHLLLGIAHDGKDGAWTFLTWDLVDLYDFRVRLKAEFQGSNRDLYQESLILRSGE